MPSCNKTKRGVKFDGAHFGKIFTHMPTVYIYTEKKKKQYQDTPTAFDSNSFLAAIKEQPSRGVSRKMCPKNMQHIYRRTPMSKCDFNKVVNNFIEITLRHACSAVKLLHIFRTAFYKNTHWRAASVHGSIRAFFRSPHA